MQHFSPRWLLTFGGSLLTLAAVAQAPAPRPATPWTDAPAARAALATTPWAGRLTAFRPVTADPAALAVTLAAAPLEGTPATPLILSLPHPDGSLVRFQVVEAPVMAPALAAQFPNIKTYAGIGLDDPTATLRADLTPEGFHAQVLSRREGGTFYIDPIQNTDMARGLVVYDRRNLRPLPGQRMVCETGAPGTGTGTGTTPAPVGGGPAPLNPTAQRVNTSLGGTLRTYRLAVAATGEYTAFHGGTVPLAQAAIVTTVNRVTGVYEKELAVRLVLVANNSTLIYTNAATDPYANTSADLAANQTNITNLIGSANYDIGHLVGTGGGGVAGLGVVCNNTQKARGLTGSPSPINDAFDIDYVAHEMGHQFSGNHPFNGSTGSCTGGNRNAATAWEPGSGSTIQGYAGICSPQDLQSNSDAYFHGGNISEMTTFINATTCPTTAASGNTPPTVGTPPNKSIPASTPFRLTATATDTDGDVLSYCWEEMDLGAQGAPVTTTTQTAGATVPLFRSFTPVASPARYFPRLNELRNNTTVYGEFLPSVARTMAFRCTVRDQRFSTGLGRIVGGVNQSNTVTLTVVNTGTPFAVTAPNTAVSYPGGSTQTVTWTVAGTTAAPISCATVNIRLSTDGGLTFPTVLTAAEPNDGSASITIPNTPATTCRVMVEANDNYFFDISNTDFTITPGVNSPTITSFTPTTGGVGTSVVITGTNLTGTSAVRFNGVASASVSGGTATSVTATVPAGASTGFIGLTATAGTATSSTVFTVPGAPTVTSFTPTAGSAGTSVTVTGTDFTGATGATFNGTAAAVTVVNATTLTTTVPAGATTGPISVTTPLGTATSASNFTVPSANDECTGTLPVLACGGSVAGTTVGSTSTNDPTATCSTITIEPASGGIWYRFIGTGGSTTLSTNGAAYDSKLFVYSGSCAALTCVTANDDISGTNLASTVTFTGTAGTPYFIFVSGYNGAQGAFTLTATCTASTITSFTPTSGPVGQSVSVTGTLLATASAVTVNNVAGTITGTPTATNVTFTVGAGSTTGLIRITTGAGVATSATNFTVTVPVNQAPTALALSNNTIAENTGANAVVGTLSTTDPDAGDTFTYTLVSGTGSTDNALVNISGNTLRITASPDFEAKASYAVRVRTTDQGSLFFEQAFTVTITDVAEATITSLSTLLGPEGTSIVVTGTNLTGATAVAFNGTNAPGFVVNSATQLTATVPVGATSGPVSVVTPNGSATSGASFAVLPIFTGTFNQCLSTTSITSTGAGTWQYLRAANGDLVAALNDQGTALGTVSVDFNLNQAAVRADAFGREYLDRNWKLTAQNAFTGQSVRVRFYARNAEFTAYTAANDGDASDVTAVSQLRLTQYSGPNEDCQLGNNGTGPGRETRLLTPASNEALAGANWFALETVVADHFSEFFFNGGAVPIGGDVTLPVELAMFEAHRLAPTQVALTWGTASERNNRGYVVQRSTNRGEFTAISGLLVGAGTTQSPQAYAYADQSAPASLLYYRLLQVDHDGSSTYSGIIAVQPAQPETPNKKLVLWPNPARSTVQVSGLEAGPVEVLDGAGRVVRTLAGAARTEAAATLPLVGLPAGVYGVRNAGRVQCLVIE